MKYLMLNLKFRMLNVTLRVFLFRFSESQSTRQTMWILSVHEQTEEESIFTDEFELNRRERAVHIRKLYG